MFRKRKKKTPAFQFRRTDENEEEEEDSSPVIVLKKKKKKQSDSNNRTTVTRNTTTTTSIPTTLPSSTATSSSRYSRESLAQLREEQSIQERKDNEKNAVAQSAALSPLFEFTSNDNDEEAFIPLNGQKEKILTGDQVDQALGKGVSLLPGNDDDDDLFHRRDPRTVVVVDDDDDDDDGWTRGVSRRAVGLKVPPTRTTNVPPPPPLSKIRQQLYEMCQQLHRQQEEEQGGGQTTTAIAHARSEFERYQRDLQQEAGPRFEYYQKLRLTMVDTVGALRALEKEWKEQMEVAALACWVDHQSATSDDDDVDWSRDVAVLLRVPTILGMTNNNTRWEEQEQPTVDEFGRSLPSKIALQRQQRWKAFQSRHQVHETDRERRVAWIEAWRVLEQTSKDVLSLGALVDTFAAWKNEYPDDYSTCYASLSLGDLIAVVLRIHLWRSFCTVSGCFQEISDLSTGLSVILRAIDSGILDSAGFGRVVEGALLPTLETFLTSKQAYTRIDQEAFVEPLGLWLRKISDCVAKHSRENVGKLQQLSEQFLTKALDRIVVPMFDDSAQQKNTSESTEGNTVPMQHDLLQYVQTTQKKRLKQIAEPLLRFWLLTSVSSQEVVLKFIATKMLPLIAAMQDEVGVNLFRHVWVALNATQWWADAAQDHIVWHLQLQAAASVYGLAAS